MSYLNAPATKLLATQCAVCAHDLVDAVSVNLGIGPDCRKKYGFNREVDPAIRAEANRIVHQVAIEQTGLAAATAATALRGLGFDKLADRILERLIDIRVVEHGGKVQVFSPYNEQFVAMSRTLPGRYFDRPTKSTFFTGGKANINRLWYVLKVCYPGTLGLGPKGFFTCEAGAKPEPIPATLVIVPSQAYLALSDADKDRIEAQEAAKEARKAAMADGDHFGIHPEELAMQEMEAAADRGQTLAETRAKFMAKNAMEGHS